MPHGTDSQSQLKWFQYIACQDEDILSSDNKLQVPIFDLDCLRADWSSPADPLTEEATNSPYRSALFSSTSLLFINPA